MTIKDRAAWCGREDSNFHGVSPTATSTLRVYQFRHDRTTGRGDYQIRAIISTRMDPEMVIEPGQVEWQISRRLVDYRAAVAEMEERVAAIRAGTASELVWLLEHPALYTAGTSARDEDLLDPQLLPVHRTGRGGRYTYHGPGQRIAYVMLDLDRRDRDVRCHVHRLEEWIIRTLARFGIKGERRDGRVGIWVARHGGE